MRKDNVSKVILWVQNSLGIIMWKFRAVQSKNEGMAASVRVFFEHPSYLLTYLQLLFQWVFLISSFYYHQQFTDGYYYGVLNTNCVTLCKNWRNVLNVIL